MVNNILINISEIWVCRRMIKGKCTERIITEQDVLARMKEEKKLMKTSRQRKHKWKGYMFRNNPYMYIL